MSEKWVQLTINAEAVAIWIWALSSARRNANEVFVNRKVAGYSYSFQSQGLRLWWRGSPQGGSHATAIEPYRPHRV